MQYRRLGNSGLKVSHLCLGTMALGEADSSSFMHGLGCDEATAFRILDRAVEAGINFLDTADVYGNDGLVEKLIGKWFAQSNKRNDVVLATKFRFRMNSGANGAGASRRHIMQAVEESLKRLQTDRIDLYQVHMQDIETPEEETLRALDDLVRAGKVQYIGASNYAAYRMADSLWTAKINHWSRFIAFQAQYSLVVREIEREHVPLCRDHGVGILPWSPLAGGFLSGKYQRETESTKKVRLQGNGDFFKVLSSEKNWQILDAVQRVAKELGSTPPRVAIAWLLAKPCVSSVIFGARSVRQLEDNLLAGELQLPTPMLQQLDKVSALELSYPYDFMMRVQKGW